MKMTSMKIGRDEAKLRETLALPTSAPEGPRYPYGLEITLDKDCIAKLGIDVTNHSAGDDVEFVAKAKITCISNRDSMNAGMDKSMILQITDLGWGPEYEED
jgi:hypothetical protein